MSGSRVNWGYLASIGLILTAVFSNCNPGPAVPEIQISNTWSRPGDTTIPGVFYLTIKNKGRARDRLLEAGSTACSAVELHETVKREEEVMAMEPVTGGLEIPARGEVTLQPGGLHLMCVDKTRDFEVGEIISLELIFSTAGPVQVEVPVGRGE